MAEETDGTVEPTESDAAGGGDAIAAFIAEEDDAPLKRAEPKPRAELTTRAPPKRDEPEEPGEAEATEKATEKPPERRTYRHKVMGEERELDAEAIDGMARQLGVEPRELLSATSLKRAAYERMREAAEARKAVEEAKALAKRDPVGALKLLGYEPEEFDRFAQERLYRKFSSEFDPTTGEPLTPELRRLRELETREAERAEADRATAERAKAEEAQRAQAESERHWVKTIVSHLEKSGDPKSILPRVAVHLGDAVATDVGSDPADLLDDALALAWEDVQAEHAKLYDSMPFEALRAKFPALVEKVRKGIVADYRSRSGQKPPEAQPVPAPRAPTRRPRTTSEIMSDFARGR